MADIQYVRNRGDTVPPSSTFYNKWQPPAWASILTRKFEEMISSVRNVEVDLQVSRLQVYYRIYASQSRGS